MKYVISIVVLSVLLSKQLVYGQSDVFYVPQTNNSWSNISNALNTQNAWAMYSNPAALVYASPLSIGVACKQMYGLTDLINSTLCVGGLYSFGAIGSTVTMFSNNYIQSYLISFHYAKQIFTKASVSVSGIYSCSQSEEFNSNCNSIIPQISATYKPYNELLLGFTIVQPIYYRLKQTKYFEEFECAASYLGIPNVVVTIATKKSYNDFLITTVGVDYTVHTKLVFSASVANQYRPLSLGIGYRISRCKFQYATSVHSFLGFSHTVSFLYSL